MSPQSNFGFQSTSVGWSIISDEDGVEWHTKANRRDEGIRRERIGGEKGRERRGKEEERGGGREGRKGGGEGGRGEERGREGEGEGGEEGGLVFRLNSLPFT